MHRILSCRRRCRCTQRDGSPPPAAGRESDRAAEPRCQPEPDEIYTEAALLDYVRGLPAEGVLRSRPVLSQFR